MSIKKISYAKGTEVKGISDDAWDADGMKNL